MKTRKLQNKLKLALLAVCMLSIGVASAQSTVDVAKTATAVRVIDNKGTIKYFQSNNGITQIVNTSANVTTTTWQLGGTLTDDTNITTGDKEFKLTLNDGTNQGTFVINGMLETTLDAATKDGSGVIGAGFTLLVRDEATGEVQKMLASDLITSGQDYFVATADNELTYTLTAVGASLPDFKQVWVYRNGAKLIAGQDYVVAGAVVTLDTTKAIGPNSDWAVYAGDVIEVQYIK